MLRVWSSTKNKAHKGVLLCPIELQKHRDVSNSQNIAKIAS
nr:MAG TPA: hypothetical protein [Caudoviricetes sp.]